MKRTRWMLLAATLAGAALATPARAQCMVAGLTGATCTQSVAITATVLRTVRVTVTPTATTLPAPTDADFVSGFSASTGPSVQVNANGAWQLTVQSATTTWTGTLGARATKPNTDLLWGTAPGGPWTPVTGTGVAIATGAATGSTVVPLFFRVAWSFADDTPGVYSIALQYTISSP